MEWEGRPFSNVIRAEKAKTRTHRGQNYFLFVSQLACITCWTDLGFSPASAKLWQRFLSRTDANAAAANRKQRRWPPSRGSARQIRFNPPNLHLPGQVHRSRSNLTALVVMLLFLAPQVRGGDSEGADWKIPLWCNFIWKKEAGQFLIHQPVQAKDEGWARRNISRNLWGHEQRRAGQQQRSAVIGRWRGQIISNNYYIHLFQCASWEGFIFPIKRGPRLKSFCPMEENSYLFFVNMTEHL